MISARHTGVNSAQGNYVTFVDADDWIALNMYKTLMDIIVKYNVELVTSGCFRYHSEEMKHASYDKFIAPGLYTQDQICEKIIPIMLWDRRSNVCSLDPSTCFKIYKRELLLPVLEELKDKKFYYGEDSAITYSYILKAANIYCTNEMFYYHRQRTDTPLAPYFFSDDYFRKLTEVYYFLYNKFISHPLKSILIKQLDYFYANSAKYKLWEYEIQKPARKDYYLFPFDRIFPGGRLIIYGAGRVGKDYMQQLEKLCYGNSVTWVDKNYASMERNVSCPDCIADMEFDYVVIAIIKDEIVKEIKDWLMSTGVPNEKIIHCILKCQM